MVISVSDLPSKGYNCNVNVINITPITFKQIMNYNKELSNTYIQKLYRDYNLLRSDIGPDFDELNFYDFDMLMLYKKSISINDSDNLEISLSSICSHCGNSFKVSKKLDDIDYTDLDEIVKKMKSITLGSRSFNICFPKMKDVKLVMDQLMKYHEDIDSELFLLLCIFNFTESPNIIKTSIESAVREEINLLEYLYTIYNGCNKNFIAQCTNERCRKENVISINNLMTDFLRLIRSNCRIDTAKIILS